MVGPKKQLKSMAKPDRIGCVVAFLFFFVMTIVTVFTGANFIVTVVTAACQVAAYVYYVLSYIPYGRKGAQKLAKQAFVRPAPPKLALVHHRWLRLYELRASAH